MIAGITSKAHQRPWWAFLRSSTSGVSASGNGGERYDGRVALPFKKSSWNVGSSHRANSFIAIAWMVNLVNDGWSGRPAGVKHQLLLLPFTVCFAWALWKLLNTQNGLDSDQTRVPVLRWLALCGLFEMFSTLGFAYEQRHFARFGYQIRPLTLVLAAAMVLASAGWIVWRRTGTSVLGGVLLTYGAGLLLAIRSFPLTYLRSDMLPVILWADQRLVGHLNPYGTMHVGSRIYDFPYLPGMLVAFLPAVAAHVDVRFVNLACVIGTALLLFGAARVGRRLEAATLLGIFLLSPFLQYRHELYLAPHWLALTAAIVLLQRRRSVWSAAAFGVSMALYQLSWVLFPFLLLNAWRRGGWREAAKTGGIGAGAMFLVLGPFLASAMHRIASNTVGQWSRLPHALADPINLSYWVTFLVRPDQLKWVQLVVLTAVFGYCVVHSRCGTLADTLRWMSVGLALFIALNVLVDGYFYLTQMLLLLMYTLAASGIWREPFPEGAEDAERRPPLHEKARETDSGLLRA